MASLNMVELAWPGWTTLSTVLFSGHDNVVTTVFGHHCCNNLLTSWNRHDNSSDHCCSINLFPTAMNNLVASLLLNNGTMLKQWWTILLVQQCCSHMIAMLFKHCSGNNPVTTCHVCIWGRGVLRKNSSLNELRLLYHVSTKWRKQLSPKITNLVVAVVLVVKSKCP